MVSLLDLWTLIQVIGKFLASKLCCSICFILGLLVIPELGLLVITEAVITELRMGREQKSRQTLHKICSEIAPSRTQISLDYFLSRVCETSLCHSVLFAFPSAWGAVSCPNLHGTTSLLSVLPFLPSNPSLRSAGRWSFWLSSLRSSFTFELCMPQLRTRERMGSAGPWKNLLVRLSS